MGRKPERHKPPDPRGLEQSPGSSNYATAAVCGFLLLAVAMVFGQTAGFGLTKFDDNVYVSENPQVTRGLSLDAIKWAFTATYASNWHPLTWLSHMLDCWLYGLRAGGHHLTSVLLHAATAIALFLVLWRMTDDGWPAAFAAAVFAVHPLRVESVAWVAERKDVLSGLCFVLTLGAYLGYARRRSSWLRYLAVVLLFALGLMAKPMLVTLPFVLLLLDYWPLARMAPEVKNGDPTASQASARERGIGVPKRELGNEVNVNWSVLPRLVAEKLPLLALSAASCAVTPLAQMETVQTIEKFSVSARIGNALVSYVAYLGQFIWPAGLAPFYPHPGSGLLIWQIVGALLLLACLSIGVLRWRRKHPWLLVGWLWYLGMLVPVIGLVQVGEQSMADRYTYLPQIGLAIALAWAAKDALGNRSQAAAAEGDSPIFAARRDLLPPMRLSRRENRDSPHERLHAPSTGAYPGCWCGAASAILMAALMGCAWRQTSYWSSVETLWGHTLACTSSNAVAHCSLGVALGDRGRFDEAIDHFQKALRIKPHDVMALNNLGSAFTKQKRYDAAMAAYREALRIQPDSAGTHGNLGVALRDQGRLDEAVAEFREAIRLDPRYVEAYTSLGVVLYWQGHLDEAADYLQKALKISPDDAMVHNNLGAVFAKQKKYDAASAEYRQALRVKSDDMMALNSLGAILYEQGRVEEAIAHYRKALEIDPRSAETHANLGRALYRQGRIREAILQWGETIRLQPQHVAALNQLAWVLATDPEASVRNGAAAVGLAQRAANLTGGRDPIVLGTLAAAHAEAGQFPLAVQTARRAMELAAQHNEQTLVESIRGKIALYEAGSPYRESR